MGMTALGQSRENLVKNANAAMEAGGISDKQCPLCGAPYSDRDELDSKIKEETELLSDISDDISNSIMGRMIRILPVMLFFLCGVCYTDVN